ncbi:hypothetical protein AAKU52_002382 [Pedobacter sp. CG_S7]
MIRPDYLIEIFKVLPSPCLVLLPNSPTFTIVGVNKAFLLFFNLKREELVGRFF